MVRLSELPDYEAEHLRAMPCPWLEPPVGAIAPPAGGRRVGLVTTAGVHSRSESTFYLADASYRVIPAAADPGEIVMSHAAVNFDRTGFQAHEDRALVAIGRGVLVPRSARPRLGVTS